MHFMPIISTLRRHRTAAALIVIEIALTCAIVSNAVFLIRDRMSRMDKPTGIAEDELVHIQITGIGKRTDPNAVTEQDLEALRAVPGVKHVAMMNMIPLGGSSWNNSVSTVPEDPDPPINVGMYMGSADLLETLDLRVASGRDFTPEEYVDFDDVQKSKVKISSVIVSRAVVDQLYPGQNALGKPLYTWGKEPTIIVGIIDKLARPNDVNGKGQSEYAMVMPVRVPFNMGGHYMIRVDPSRKAEVLAAAEVALNKVDASRIILKRQTFAEIRSEFFEKDRAMAYLLLAVSLLLLVITALGVVGLASFWVQQRTRQIGIRRALGATRTDILRYFQLENFILATVGIVLGMGLAYAINLALMASYEVPRLPAEFLPIGALLLWVLGQIAVLGPAMRASMIPPALATRSV